MMSHIRMLLSATIVTACLSLAPKADAAPLLHLSVSDGINAPIVLTDLASTGSLVTLGALGDWIFNVTSGTGFPITGTLDKPLIDLNSINVANTGGGTLTLALSETGLVDDQPSSLFAAAIGGSVSTNPGSSLSYSAYTDSTNATFGTETLIGSGIFGPGAFAYSNIASGQTGALYSFTQVVVLTAQIGATNTNISFNGELRKVPEPASLAILGVALAGLGAAVRRKTA